MREVVGVEDVLQGKATPGTLMRRGVTKRCPRCGGRGIFRGYFRMRPRCPTCGYLFEREPGFFVGAYLINFAIIEGFLFVLVMAFVFWKSQHPEAGMLVPALLGVSFGVIGPVIFYPYSQSIWSALDLLMTPLEMSEIVDAADAMAELRAQSGRTAEAGETGEPT